MTYRSNPEKDYTIVIPVYYNEGSLRETMASIKGEVIEKNPTLHCEIIFVDDGSGDGSLNELLEIRERNQEIVTVLKLTRNFGQVSALLAGLSYAKGRCAIAMSADNQDPAILINEMLKAHFEEKYEIVAGAREGRDESYYRILTSRFFYRLMKKLSFPSMPDGGFDFVLLGRKVIDLLLRNKEAHGFFQGQILWTGFKTKFIPYQRRQREAGKSRWTFGKKLTYLIDGVMSYSFFPIRLISLLGILFSIVGFLYALLIFVTKLFWGLPIKGWAPLMIVVLVMGGIQMLMLGIIGEYLWRSLAQARNRDPYIIECVFGDDADEEKSTLKRSDEGDQKWITRHIQ